MALIEALNLVKYDELTDAQKSDLRYKLEERKRDLEAATQAVNDALARLGTK